MNIAEVIEEGERVVEHTLTGRRLIEKGIEKGVEQTRRDDIRRFLEGRFGPLPEHLRARLAQLTDVAALEELVTQAAVAISLDDFERHVPPAP